MDEKLLENWINSIEQLKTSNRSVVRTINRIVCGEKEPVSTQTATRPLRILCCLNQEYKNLQEILYLILDYPHKHYTFKHFEV